MFLSSDNDCSKEHTFVTKKSYKNDQLTGHFQSFFSYSFLYLKNKQLYSEVNQQSVSNL